jgi:hypothetical protein
MRKAGLWLILLIALTGVTACNSGTAAAPDVKPEALSTNITDPITAPSVYAIPPERVNYDLKSDIIAPYGKEAEITLSFTNTAAEEYVMSPFPPMVRMEVAHLLYPERTIRSFEPGSGEFAFLPGESAEYTFAWDQRDDSGQQVTPGWYGVHVFSHSYKASDPSRIGGPSGWAAQVLVLPAGGALEKTIEVNQTKVIEDISMTLERVELSAQGMKVYASHPPVDSQFYVHAQIEYRVDGGVWKSGGASSVNFVDGGREQTWEHLDALPQDARELGIRIYKIRPLSSEMFGPWEFNISLK